MFEVTCRHFSWISSNKCLTWFLPCILKQNLWPSKSLASISYIYAYFRSLPLIEFQYLTDAWKSSNGFFKQRSSWKGKKAQRKGKILQQIVIFIKALSVYLSNFYCSANINGLTYLFLKDKKGKIASNDSKSWWRLMSEVKCSE